MFRAFVTCYPWDMLDDELHAKLDHLQGTVGIAGLTLWAACPPAMQIRTRLSTPQTTRTRGGFLFHAEEKQYSATRVKPITSSWVKSKNPIERLATACAERGLQLRVKISAALTGRIAQKHPEAACKNLFGATSHVSLCLFNPDVESYLAALLADLTSNHAVAGVSVSDFFVSWREAFDPELRLGVPLDATLRSVLSICFCESCLQGAAAREIDVDKAQQCAKTYVQSRLDGTALAAVPFDDVLADSPELAAFDRWRLEGLTALLGRLQGDGKIILDRGGPITRLDRPVFSIPHSMTVVTEINSEGSLKEALCTNAQQNEIRIPIELFTGSHAKDLVNVLPEAVEAGFSGAEFDNYALASEQGLESIRQAIRYARRS